MAADHASFRGFAFVLAPLVLSAAPDPVSVAPEYGRIPSYVEQNLGQGLPSKAPVSKSLRQLPFSFERALNGTWMAHGVGSRADVSSACQRRLKFPQFAGRKVAHPSKPRPVPGMVSGLHPFLHSWESAERPGAGKGAAVLRGAADPCRRGPFCKVGEEGKGAGRSSSSARGNRPAFRRSFNR